MAPRKRVVDLSYLRIRAQEEAAPVQLTAAEHEKRLGPSEREQFQYTVRQWKEFSDEILEIPIMGEPFPSAPSVYQIKMFLEWFAQSRTGNIETRITDITLANRLSYLKRAIQSLTNFRFSKAETKDLERTIRDLIKEGKITTKGYEKPIATIDVTQDIVQFLWACDEYQHLHPRAYCQLAFYIELLADLGARPGEIVESDCHNKSNEGLQYSDVDLIRDKTGEYMINVRLRYRKCNRLNEKSIPAFQLYESPQERSLCPVTLFLALALADQVFEGISSFDQLDAVKIRPGDTRVIYRYKQHAKSLPILRSISKSGEVSATNILNYNCASNALKALGQRAGYKETLTAYSFRRNFARCANQLNPHIRRIGMGHTNNETMKYYITGTQDIDGQAIVRDQPQRLDKVNEMVSMKSQRNLNAPKPPGSQLIDLPPRVTHNLECSDSLEDKRNPIVSKIELTASQEASFRRQFRQRAYQKARQEFFEDGAYTEGTSIPVTSLRQPSRYLRALLKFEPSRRSIISLLYPNANCNGSDSKLPLRLILEPMIEQANPQKRRYGYSSVEQPEGSCCSVCKKNLNKLRPNYRNSHLLKCTRIKRIQDATVHMTRQFEQVVRTCRWNNCGYQFNHKTCKSYSTHVSNHINVIKSHECLWDRCNQRFEDSYLLAWHVSKAHDVPNEQTVHTSMHYCYEHDNWCASEQSWKQHLLYHHFPHINDFCGLIIINSLVVVAAHCLFCLGGQGRSTDMSTRFKQFDDVHKLHTHMEKHISQIQDGWTTCPHPRCKDQISTRDAFWNHAVSVHGIPRLEDCQRTQKRKVDEDDDSSDKGPATKRLSPESA